MTTAMLNIGTKHWKTACKKAEQDLKDADKYIVELQCEIEKIEAATIERCAQVAESYGNNDANCAIARAIRALKDSK